MGPIGPYFCLFWYQKHKYTCFFEKGHVKNWKKRPLPGRPEESWPNWFLPQNPKSHQIEIWIARIEATHLINPPAPFFIHFEWFFEKITKAIKIPKIRPLGSCLGSLKSRLVLYTKNMSQFPSNSESVGHGWIRSDDDEKTESRVYGIRRIETVQDGQDKYRRPPITGKIPPIIRKHIYMYVGSPPCMGSPPCIWVPHHVFRSMVSGIRYQVSK